MDLLIFLKVHNQKNSQFLNMTNQITLFGYGQLKTLKCTDSKINSDYINILPRIANRFCSHVKFEKFFKVRLD